MAYMNEVAAALNAMPVFNERAALKLVEEPLERLKAASADDRIAFLFEALEQLRLGAGSFTMQLALKGMAAAILRTRLPLNMLDAVRLVEAGSHSRQTFPYKALLTALEGVEMTPALRDALLRMRTFVDEWHGSREMQEIHERIDALVHGAKPESPLKAAAGWTTQVLQEIDRSPKQLAWRALMLNARSLTQSTPSRKWQSETISLVDRIGRAEFLDASRRWLAIGPMPGSTQVQMPEDEADYQKGFIWTLGVLGDTSVAPAIADFAVACFRKIPQIGAVSHRVGNACLNALSAMPGLDAVTQLSRLGMRVKYDVAQRLIEKALSEAAVRNNVSRADLEAMSVPSFGLDAGGVRRESFDGCETSLAIIDGSATLTWSRDGKPLKSVPASVKSEHGPALAELKKAYKELDIALSTQRLRLERQLLSNSTCQFDRWKAWYLEHPVMSTLAARLIWEIDGHAAMWRQGELVDWAGHPVAAAPESAVRLWHPIRSDVQTVLSWRCWLEDHGIRQPFKQAHREVYLLTDAERQTSTYSNRFAAHIVRQHQFAALCRERGWQFNLMGQWDSHNTPSIDLPLYKLRAEFHVDFPLNEETSGHAIYLTICTDRIQFYDLEAKPEKFSWPPPQPKQLKDIPAVVFSEIMRDADLLVSVTSIGSDPAWGDTHRDDPHMDYWQGFAFGELTTAAENRRSILEALLPKLAIGSQCRLDGRFLVVRGELQEYRIHLGSGNVIMEPGSRYLCIVQGPGDSAASLPLPFDGDRILSVILSKAMLLANDTAIRDETIVRQIR